MLLLVLILVLIAFGLLVVALLTGSVLWAWVSVGVSVAAAAVLLIDWMMRRSAVRTGSDAVATSAGAEPIARRPDIEPVTEVLPVLPAAPGLAGAAAATSRMSPPPRTAPTPEPAVGPGDSAPGGPVNGAPQVAARSPFGQGVDGDSTVVMPVVRPSGSADRPSGATPVVTPPSESRTRSVVETGAAETVSTRLTKDAPVGSASKSGVDNESEYDDDIDNVDESVADSEVDVANSSAESAAAAAVDPDTAFGRDAGGVPDRDRTGSAAAAGAAAAVAGGRGWLDAGAAEPADRVAPTGRADAAPVTEADTEAAPAGSREDRSGEMAASSWASGMPDQERADVTGPKSSAAAVAEPLPADRTDEPAAPGAVAADSDADADGDGSAPAAGSTGAAEGQASPAADPVAAQQVAAEPTAPEPMAAEPTAAEQVAAEPTAAEPPAAEHVAPEPTAAEHVGVEQTAAEVDAAGPEAVPSEPEPAVGTGPDEAETTDRDRPAAGVTGAAEARGGIAESFGRAEQAGVAGGGRDPGFGADAAEAPGAAVAGAPGADSGAAGLAAAAAGVTERADERPDREALGQSGGWAAAFGGGSGVAPPADPTDREPSRSAAEETVQVPAAFGTAERTTVAGTVGDGGWAGAGASAAGRDPGSSGAVADRADSAAERTEVGAGAVADGPAQPDDDVAVQSVFDAAPPPGDDEPPEEPTDPTVAQLVAGLEDEVVVIDERPRYHTPDCRGVFDRAVIPLSVREAVELGFTPCAWCAPNRRLASQHPAPAR